MLVLGVGATAVGYLLYFGLIAGAGASRAILVTYLVPPMALVYGAVFLDEQSPRSRSPGSRSCSPGSRSARGARRYASST